MLQNPIYKAIPSLDLPNSINPRHSQITSSSPTLLSNMPSLASIGLTLFCLLEWALSHNSGVGVSELCKRQSLDPGPGGLNLSSGGKLLVSNADGQFSDQSVVQRWSDFQNPSFVAVVQAANEGDVVNTVSFPPLGG